MRELYWLDYETTGLVADEHRLLEVAVARADFYDPYKIEHVYNAVFQLGPEEVKTFDPLIIDMHTKNGLFEDCFVSTRTVWRAEQDLLKIVPWVENKEDRPTLAGSTVSFDHGFMKKHMPELAKRFSHRHFDVSSKKLDCQTKGMAKLPKAEAHRAVDDIEESVAHGVQCEQWLLRFYNSIDALRGPNARQRLASWLMGKDGRYKRIIKRQDLGGDIVQVVLYDIDKKGPAEFGLPHPHSVAAALCRTENEAIDLALARVGWVAPEPGAGLYYHESPR